MRISDRSSDVCSSDLVLVDQQRMPCGHRLQLQRESSEAASDPLKALFTSTHSDYCCIPASACAWGDDLDLVIVHSDPLQNHGDALPHADAHGAQRVATARGDRKSTRLNSSH